MQEVSGSNPLFSTVDKKGLRVCVNLFSFMGYQTTYFFMFVEQNKPLHASRTWPNHQKSDLEPKCEGHATFVALKCPES